MPTRTSQNGHDERARIASDFQRLKEWFEKRADRDTKPSHLLAAVEQSAVQAGRLLDAAAGAGAFEGDSWWRDGRSPAHPRDRYDSDIEFYRALWFWAIGSWLARKYPTRFRVSAVAWDWAVPATDKNGRLLDKDGKPLRYRWYRDGEPLPDDWTGDLSDGAQYESRMEGTPAEAHDFYDEPYALVHLRFRAAAYSDACRVLAELIRERHEATPIARLADAPVEPPGTTEGERSAPMTRAEMARRLTDNQHARTRGVKDILKGYGLRQESGQKYTLRLDMMDANTRRKLEKPA